MITLDYSNVLPFIGGEEAVKRMEPQVKTAHDMLHKKNGPGNDFLGWLDLPTNYDKEEFARIRKAAQKIRRDSDVLVVIGIGGSYLGARAVIELLNHSFANVASKKVRKSPIILFCGNSISATYLADMMDIIEGKDISLNIISKSGTTTEPAIAFRILRAYMENKYGKEEAKNRIYATTDKAKGALKGLADEEGYESFVVPDDVGGRFSVLTAVGLLPIAVSGIDIRELMKGAKDASKAYKKMSLEENPCYQYAAVRNCLLRSGYSTEVMVNYEPSFHYMTEWWKQLYGESEGKDLRGIFPAGVDNTTDLHSMGQFIQDGARIMFETVVNIDAPRRSFEIPNDPANLDGLNFLSGMDMNEVNKKAMQGTVLAHVDGKVPNMAVHMAEQNAYNLGELIYFFEKACGISGYLLAVNPFNQPGVEAYKKNMFALLGKPGYEDQKAALEARLK
ncbi:glucose-6-phosphate isomerase [Oscillospiraceae bacterium]|jgi:glucose-6-phosphate isomerase|nr:glucose-6-phosphate isomerase [Saccharofermentans sp.]SMC46411.1 glucose-6-phosphate isomerase [Oscillospiraceae bacterium]